MKMISRYVTTIALLGAAIFAAQVSAHGYVKSPSSRAYQCNQGINVGCGSVQYEPQSIEGPKGFPESGPPDGHIASGNKAAYFQLDEQTPTRWHKVNMNTGDNTFVWYLTAQHSTTSWRYFITKTGWDASQPLSRAAFDLTPFCQINDGGAIPPMEVVHKCTIPKDRKGSHVILAVWDIADTANAFYQAIDVNLSN
ncbi:lytic polysaccharide monooxygenase [Budvicia diplopodorum]|uniref:lytic polysaccharide monooxygenase n=1 Tax=Budvicia diplopodorum TaxID=1119056 RepID=UPI00135C82AD|nr:lytic polysaccharide monooxygenase [Budvicia diplopodorum]